MNNFNIPVNNNILGGTNNMNTNNNFNGFNTNGEGYQTYHKPQRTGKGVDIPLNKYNLAETRFKIQNGQATIKLYKAAKYDSLLIYLNLDSSNQKERIQKLNGCFIWDLNKYDMPTINWLKINDKLAFSSWSRNSDKIDYEMATIANDNFIDLLCSQIKEGYLPEVLRRRNVTMNHIIECINELSSQQPILTSNTPINTNINQGLNIETRIDNIPIQNNISNNTNEERQAINNFNIPGINNVPTNNTPIINQTQTNQDERPNNGFNIPGVNTNPVINNNPQSQNNNELLLAQQKITELEKEIALLKANQSSYSNKDLEEEINTLREENNLMYEQLQTKDNEILALKQQLIAKEEMAATKEPSNIDIDSIASIIKSAVNDMKKDITKELRVELTANKTKESNTKPQQQKKNTNNHNKKKQEPKIKGEISPEQSKQTEENFQKNKNIAEEGFNAIKAKWVMK